ncbi:MAG: ABC transporter ATP-binding protein, partial [Deltaproteobacteria bacterium]|nr:ABC transporter ATP-binding protein [Deltaproteobacteria bacterium]
EVLRDINVHVNAGEVVTILGANGAGKTTLLRILSGLLQPTGGTIQFNNEDIHGRPAYKIMKMGLIQVPEGRGILGSMTVRENLIMGCYGENKKDQLKRLNEIYEKFPLLQERQNQLGGLLSGGEQTILSIARGMIGKPRCLILDEPSLGLAPVMVDMIFSILRDLKNTQLTVLLVEQNATQALDISDRAYVMEVGEIVAEGTIEELLSDNQIVEAYLGV